MAILFPSPNKLVILVAEIIIALIDSSPGFSKLAVIAFWAAIGGLFVVVGLIMEVFWEKHWYRNVPDHRRSETIRLWGAKLVTFGVAWEVVSAGVFAIKEEYDKRKMAAEIAKNDPYNGNISDISAFVYFEVKGRDVADITRTNGFFGKAEMILGNTLQFGSTLPFLGADNFSRGNAISDNPLLRDGRSYSLRFQSSGLRAMMVGTGMTWPVKEIDDVKFLMIYCSFLTNNAEVFSGAAEVVINGSIRRMFIIPPQIPRRQFFEQEDNPDFPHWVIATNCDVQAKK